MTEGEIEVSIGTVKNRVQNSSTKNKELGYFDDFDVEDFGGEGEGKVVKTAATAMTWMATILTS